HVNPAEPPRAAHPGSLPPVRRPLVLMIIVTLAAGSLAFGTSAAAATRRLRIVAISTGPKYVTGGDVLLRVRNAIAAPTFSAGGTDLAAKQLGRFAWLVRGLPLGPSR